MFQLLKDPDFNLMGRRNVMLAISTVLVLGCVALLASVGINKGTEFTGGTELRLKFVDEPDLGAIRSTLASLAASTPQVTTLGDRAEREVYIKLGSKEAVAGSSGDDQTQQVVDQLRQQLFKGRYDETKVDLNTADEKTLRDRLNSSPAVAPQDAETLARAILERRKDVAIFRSLDELGDLAGMTEEARAALEQGAFVGRFAIRSQSYIGPAIGKELRDKALLAILGSLVGMLIYIWIRFQLRWGLAAVAALTHDTLITLGLFSLAGMEMSLPVVAAFLTLVGYSVNDTVVVFDRIRENVRTRGAAMAFDDLVNRSLNQTLSRTIITSGSTWIVVLGLFLFGGEALRAFAFVLSVGVLIGTYSSIYVASPILILWQAVVAKKKRSSRTAEPAAQRRDKKVQPTSAG